MSEEKIPEYLYYYTDIDTLALILKNHTIRLNSLDKMDDKQEQMSKDVQNYGRFVFISSWTEDETESIPMWRMYTPKGRGVRIKLKTNPFKLYDLEASEFAQEMGIKNYQSGTLNFKIIVPVREYLQGDFTILNRTENEQLLRIEYTDDENKLNPSIMKKEGTGVNYELGDLGLYKNTYWKFQKEWRYRLLIFPISTKKVLNFNSEIRALEFAKFHFDAQKGLASLPFNYYDLIIREDCFKDMSIMLSPDITESSKIFANLLVKEFNPSCTITESVLTNLIQ